MITVLMSQMNLKRLTFKMFEVVQVTLVVDLPRLENVYVSKS